MFFDPVFRVQEFTAPPGVVLVPYHILDGLGLTEGSTVNIDLSTPPDGSYIKLQPHKTEFIELPDPKALLEKALSVNYPVVTEGHTITIQNPESDKVYHIDIVKTEPFPISLSTFILPPKRLTSFLHIANPSPVPSLQLQLLSTCSNARKIFS